MKSSLKRIFLLLLMITFALCVLSACKDEHVCECKCCQNDEETEETEENPEKIILGKWYNDDGDCMTVLSDNTYSIDMVDDFGYEIGMNRGKWEYLEEEGFFKFHASNYDKDVISLEVKEDENGTYFKYTYFGTFFKEE